MIASGNVAHGREAARKNVSQEPLRILRPIRYWWLWWIHLKRIDVDVNMIVNQPRHQRSASAVDSIRSFGLDRSAGDLLDFVTLDNHERGLLCLGTDPVEQRRILEHSA